MTNSPEKFKVAPEVRWVVERRGLLLVKGSQKHLHIEYPQAAVWDLVSRGYRLPVAVRMLAHIATLDEPDAERLLLESLHEWFAMGFLVREENHG
ncbi:MAG: hypothetical protein ACE5HS_10465 [bacterium]